ncbi:MAG: HNH endonuclease [bacterium]|nr:HNH endonuclease [bacterium]
MHRPEPSIEVLAAADSIVADSSAPHDRYGAEQLIRPRLGQGAFRLAVTEAYARSCAATGEHSLPVLDAAHIQPYADGGAHEITNGLLLRADLHRLYDAGYVTVTPDYEFRVSPALRDEYANGRIYYDLEHTLRAHRATIRLPANPAHRPDRERLAWHVEGRFRS